MELRAELARSILRLVLFAAVATAPLFLFAEGADLDHLVRVLASNGVTALLCIVLLAALRRGHVAAVARGLSFGMLALVGTLAWSNGEPVHVNVVNFVFVTLLANVLLATREFFAVAAISSALLCGIALKGPAGAAAAAHELDARFEAIGQFLPTFSVIVAILWLRERALRRG